MNEITVTSQQQLDNLPHDCHGRIYIKFGTPHDKAIVRRKYDFASVEAWGNSSVEARDNSSVEALENSSVEARDNSSVVAWGNSSVEARGNSCVVARGNSQINQKSDASKINASSNARVVHDPHTIDEYVDFYGIENSNGKAKLFKAVRKHDGVYRSDWDANFVYTIGESVAADGFCADPNENCGRGIHMAYLDWCLEYGNCWTDLAILEVEADMSTVVVPKCGSGKVRAPSCKVIREVPLEECGLYGKVLAKRRNGGAA